MLLRIKHALFQHFTLLVVFAGVVVVVLLGTFGARIDWKIVVPVVSVVISMIFFAQKQRLDELRLFSELFATFNERYDEMNEGLSVLTHKSSFSADDCAMLIDYFNLCGEEYLYYRLGYVYPEVWDAWLSGMRFYYANSAIGTFWEAELAQGSYYGLKARLLKPDAPPAV